MSARAVEIARGIDLLIARLSPVGAWSPPRAGNRSTSWCISDAMFIDLPGGFIPLRGYIGEYLGYMIGNKTTTYFWENEPDRTQAEVLDLLNRAFEKVMSEI